MPKLVKAILGKVQGALGDVTFRQRNGKNYLSTRPTSRTPSDNPASVAARGKFALSVQLAKSVYSISELKSVWTVRATSGSSGFNQIVRTNYTKMSSTDLSEFVKLVPPYGFNVMNPVVVLGPSEVKVNLDAIGNLADIDVAAEPSMRLVSVIFMTGPADSEVGEYAFLRYVSEIRDTDLTSALEFTLTLSDVDAQLLAKYQNKKGFFVLLTLDATGKVMHYSNTFTG